MTVDLERLASHRLLEDPERRLRERFLTREIGGAGTVAVLSEPWEGRASMGWVVCGSFAMDQAYLLSLETALARRLAAGGFAALRYHAQGYGDSETDAEQVTLSSHVRDARDAVEILRETAGVQRVGLAGALFGGSVAALAAPGAEALVMIQPVVRGSAYIRATVRRSIGTSLPNQAEGPARDRADVMDVEGFPLRPEVVEEFEAFDLRRELTGVPGRALVIQVSRSTEAQGPLAELVEQLASGGARAELRVVAHPEALRFGLPRHRRAGGERKVDVQADLTDGVLQTVARWCGESEVAAGAHP
jgi:pimeloyl-ACP methyl ester carboxylesterase